MKESANYTEQEWLQLLSAGSEEAFAQLYRSHRPAMVEQAMRLVKLEAPAEDICNEIFLNLWQNREQAAAITSLRAYLTTAVRNRSLNVLKKMARSRDAQAEIANIFPGTTLATEAALLEKEYVLFIRRSLSLLPHRAREVFTLCREEGCSYDDVSARLGISRHAVKHHMVHSVKKLKALAEKDLGISLSILLIFLLS